MPLATTTSWADHWFEIVMLLFSAVIAPSVTWLVGKVLSIDKEVAGLKLKYDHQETRCKEHQEFLKEISEIARKTQRNIIRLGDKLNVDNLEEPN